ncbi:hypothetical protein [Ideonella sp. YS5]|uniref:hypothetical protein n=1 Tax=Ideonella sp. YS5 TaxID=3453714 RepID=UPI003EEA4275
MPSPLIRLAAVASAVVLVTGAQAKPLADAAGLTPAQLAHLARSQAHQRAISPLYNYDIKPPVLKSVGVGGKVHANLKNAQAVVSLSVADNLSGVDTVVVTLVSPTGQTASGSWDSPFEATRNELQIGVDMSNVADDGEWHLYSVSVVDANGNVASFDEATLASLGRTTLQVVGATGDYAWPSAQAGGVNLTPTVSRSTPPRGMLPGSWARVGVKLKLVDTGGSGLRAASMTYCMQDTWWDCIYLSADVPVRGKDSQTLTLGGKITAYTTPGVYVPYSLEVYDYAGNSNTFYQDEISSYLDNPAITITE